MICKRCLNDSSVRKISFNADGICSYCEKYEEIKDKINDYPKLEKLFTERMESVKGKYDYDAAVGISGGKDSMYVLYMLVSKYQLKVKAFTMNNGFLSEQAKQNINQMVKRLGVEHEYIEFDKAKLQKFYHYSMKKWLVPCIACSYIGYASMINYASKINAGMVIHGRSPEQMFRYYDNDVFSELVKSGLGHVYETDINALYTGLLQSIHDKMDEEIMHDVKSMLLSDIDGNDLREFTAYFLYHRYNESEIVAFLKKETGWLPPKDYNHYDCMIHNAARYIYQKAEGRVHTLPEISYLVRCGEMSREQGEEKLQSLVMQTKPTEELDRLCSFAGVNQTSLFLKAAAYSKVISKWKR